jgi:hypothetical protein
MHSIPKKADLEGIQYPMILGQGCGSVEEHSGTILKDKNLVGELP